MWMLPLYLHVNQKSDHDDDDDDELNLEKYLGVAKWLGSRQGIMMSWIRIPLDS